MQEAVGQDTDSEAMTLGDLMKVWGRGKTATITAVMALVNTGKASELYVTRFDTAGRRHRCRAYKLL